MISLGEARKLCQLIKFSIKCWKILEMTIPFCALQVFIEIYWKGLVNSPRFH